MPRLPRLDRTGAQLIAAVAVVGLLAGCAGGDETGTVADGAVVSSSTGLEQTTEPTADTGTDPELVQNSERIDEALAPVQRHIEQGGEGFAAIRENNRALTATVQWKRPVPSEIRQLEGKTESGVTISIEEVSFSRADIDEATARLQTAASNGEIEKPMSYRANDQFGGLEVGYGPEKYADMNTATQRAALERIAGIPVSVVQSQRVQPASS